MAPKSQSATAPYLSSQIGVFESLEAPILNNRGARYEGDIFSVLWQSPYILRSWEFALADGAIDCNQHFELGTSFVDRLWKTKSHFQSGASKLLLFDVKSKVSREAGDQIYNTSARQQNAVAFYIGICAADTSFVELIPNIYQNNGDGTEGPSENRELAVNISRASRLHASAYRLDPCNSPYRMPLALLLEAIHRVRRCVQGKGPYVNPWTLVEFPDWIPSTTSSTESLTPAEDTQHFTAYKAAMEIGRLIRIQSNPAAMELDLVGLQPRLADFKLITIPQTSESQTSHRYQSRSQRRLEGRDLRQSFIQHKLDGKDRSRYSPLSKVAVARGEGKDRRWYFSAFDRSISLLHNNCANTDLH